MITFVVGQVDLEQLQAPVQILHQAQPLHQQMHRTDAPAVDALHARCHLVMNVPGFKHRPRLVFPVLGSQSAFDSLLAVPENLGVVSFHSKWPFVGRHVCCDKHISTSIYGHFELFLCA